MKWLVFLSLILISCIDRPITELFSSSDEARSQLRDRVRSRSLGDSSVRCAESKSCTKTCDDIYLKAKDLDRCYNSRESRIKAISDVFEVLIHPETLSALNDIEDRAFADFLNIGYRGFLDIIDPVHKDEDGDRRNTPWGDIRAYGFRSAQLVLEWIANEKKIAHTLLAKDDQMEIIRHLFCIAGKSVSSQEKKKQYVCDLWGNCNNKLPTDTEIENWTNTEGWNDDTPQSIDCHENRDSLYIGLTQGVYDGVDFYTYAEAQDNEDAVRMGGKMITEMCLSKTDLEEKLLCESFYVFPILQYSGNEILKGGKCSDENSCHLRLYKNALGLCSQLDCSQIPLSPCDIHEKNLNLCIPPTLPPPPP